MPIEIKELHIRVNVKDNADVCKPESAASGKNEAPKNVDRIVQECVEKVLEVIQQEKQR